MGRTPTTVVLDDEVLAHLRRAADLAGLDDSAVIERALRRYLSLDVVDRVWERNAADPLDPDRAEDLAYSELRAGRRS
jgi:Arc/MetJ family transcription regulator